VGRRCVVAVAVVIVFGVLASSAGAQAPDSATTAMNILPSGQYQTNVPGASREAELYNALTPLRDNVTDDMLPRFFKSEAMEPGPIVRTETVPERPGLEIRRDEYNVPHIYGQTDDDVTYGMGYAIAEDRNLLLNQARYDGLVAEIDVPNVNAIDLISNVDQFEPSKQTESIVAQQTKVLRQQGAKGRQLLHDMDTFLDGINTWYAANQPSMPRFTRNDIYAFNAVKAQFLGQGGGQEPQNAQFLGGLQHRFGDKRGLSMFEDLRDRNDPDTRTTIRKSAPYNPLSSSRKGVVPIRDGSYVPSGPRLPATAAAATSPRGPAEASNILVASGSRSATGHPQFVGGPQIRYFLPGLLEEMGLHGPNIDVRGATSVPFPGYMLIGRSEHFAWTLTSAEADIIDSYAETLCGGSRLRYEYKGKCRAMEKVKAGTIVAGDKRVPVTFYKTVHGSVYGYARNTKGKLVAVSQRRSSYGRETVDELFFQDLTYGRIHSFADFAKSAAQTPQTFNAFYADSNTAGMYTTGALPIRPKGADGDVLTDGRGKYEWTGYLAASKHPQGTAANGLLVNWNNKPAPDFAASDSRFGDETMLPRQQLLTNALAGQQQHTLGTVVGAMNYAATQDVRGALLWPIMRAMLDRGSSPSALASAAVQQIDAWAADGAPRLDLDGDGNIDAPAVAIMDAGWDRIADAAMCPALGRALCDQLATVQRRFDSPNRTTSNGQYSGWFHYMAKDFSTELGRRVKQPYSRRYCGNGSVKKCTAALWKAIDQTATALAAQQGPDPSAWRESAAAQTIRFAPLPLIPMAYTNRPSGIQQVISFQNP
jgi:acyl-homoserine lactone acylase PvdQ